MSTRTPAGEKGTADRIEADDGGFWVRLVSKQALRREGVCMDNCLDTLGYGQSTAGEEDMVSDGFWSLRKADGLSHMLVRVHANRPDAFVGDAAGPKNNQPSGWCCRQLRHLVAAFLDAGATLRIPGAIALTGEDGRTWRPDKAPQDLKDAAAARQKAEAERRAAPYAGFTYGRITVRPTGSTVPMDVPGSWTEIETMDVPGSWTEIEISVGAGGSSGSAPRRQGEGPGSGGGGIGINALDAREAAIAMAMEQGIVTHHVVSPRDGEALSIRPRGRLDEIMTSNGDGTYAMRLGSYTFPRVSVTHRILDEFDVRGTVTVEIAPPSRPPDRAMRTLDGGLMVVPERWGETRHSPGIITP